MKKLIFIFLFFIIIINTAFCEPSDEYILIASRLFYDGYSHEAIQTLIEGIRLYPNNAMLHAVLGNAYYHINDTALSLEYLSRAIELDRTISVIFAIRAQVFESINDYDRALNDFNMTIYLEPENDEYYWQRGNFLYTCLNYSEQALNDFNRAIEINPLNYIIFHQRGEFFISQGQNELALNDFNEAIKLNNEDAKSFISRGNTFFRLGKHKEAMEDFDTAIMLDSRDFRGFFGRGLSNIKLGRFNEAISDFTEMIKLDHTLSYAFLNRSIAYRFLANQVSHDSILDAWQYLQMAQEDEEHANRLNNWRY